MPARWRQAGIKNRGVHTDEADWADALIAPGALHLPRATTKKLLWTCVWKVTGARSDQAVTVPSVSSVMHPWVL